MSQRDERQMRYEAAAHAVSPWLAYRDPEQILDLANELPGRLAGASGAAAAERAVDEALNPPRGVARAVRLLAEEYDLEARVCGTATIVLDEPVPGLPEPTLANVLHLADEPGPVFGRAVTEDGRKVLAAWRVPWFVVEKATTVGAPMVRAWHLAGETLYVLAKESVLPRADITAIAGAGRPAEVADLLALADEDVSQRVAKGRVAD